MRPILSVVSVFWALVSCSLLDPGGCDDVDSEFIPGFEVTGVAVATNGLGYVSGIASFGDCKGTYEARFYKIDANARTAERVEVDFVPGKVLVSPDGEHAAVMGFRKPFAGVVGGVPEGVAFVSGSTVSRVTLGSTAYDIQPAGGGWIVSAGSGGSWLLSFDGTPTQVTTTPSYCGAVSQSHTIVCADTGVTVLDSSGNVVNTIVTPSDPFFAAAGGDAVVVVHGTGASSIVATALTQTFGLSGSIWGDVWVSPNSASALVQSTYGTQRLLLAVGETKDTNDNVHAFDAAFSADGSLAVVAYRDYGLVVIDIPSGEIAGHVSPNQTAGIEPLGGSVFLIAGGKGANQFRPGDVATGAFQIIEVLGLNDVVRVSTWDLVVD